MKELSKPTIGRSRRTTREMRWPVSFLAVLLALKADLTIGEAKDGAGGALEEKGGEMPPQMKIPKAIQSNIDNLFKKYSGKKRDGTVRSNAVRNMAEEGLHTGEVRPNMTIEGRGEVRSLVEASQSSKLGHVVVKGSTQMSNEVTKSTKKQSLPTNDIYSDVQKAKESKLSSLGSMSPRKQTAKPKITTVIQAFTGRHKSVSNLINQTGQAWKPSVQPQPITGSASKDWRAAKKGCSFSGRTFGLQKDSEGDGNVNLHSCRSQSDLHCNLNYQSLETRNLRTEKSARLDSKGKNHKSFGLMTKRKDEKNSLFDFPKFRELDHENKFFASKTKKLSKFAPQRNRSPHEELVVNRRGSQQAERKSRVSVESSSNLLTSKSSHTDFPGNREFRLNGMFKMLEFLEKDEMLNAERAAFTEKIKLFRKSAKLAKHNQGMKKETDYPELADYEIVKDLGQGSFGLVKLAINEKGEKVAIKVFENAKVEAKQMKKNLLSEVKLLRLVNHINIVKLIDFIEGARFSYLVMEYAGPLCLRDFLETTERSTLTEAEAVIIFYSVAKSLLFLHSKYIYHRDLKLDNIIVNSQGLVKLIDFGFAVQVKGPDEKLDKYCGTPCYMPPEMLSKKKYSGDKVDVWSFGVALYRAVVGRFPFRGTVELIKA
jgi:serine/threonine protein kinase